MTQTEANLLFLAIYVILNLAGIGFIVVTYFTGWFMVEVVGKRVERWLKKLSKDES